MFDIEKLFFFYGFCYFSVQCLIPTLNVQKLDGKLIERKRQDTLEMCKMFIEENNKVERFTINNIEFANHNALKSPRRIKRDLTPANTNLNYADVKRIENIVDKLYDDMAEHGERVSYRQRNLSTVKFHGSWSRRDCGGGEKLLTGDIKVALMTDDFNREDGFKLAQAWNPVVGMCKSIAVSSNKSEDVVSVVCRDTPPTSLHNQTARRFNFRPAELIYAPSSTPESLMSLSHDTSYEIPWQKNWKHGIVPYYIDANTYDTHLADIIIKAFDYFEKATCIRLQRLREKPTDKDSLKYVEWLYISNPSGIRQCVHSNEQKSNRGVQMVVFGYECLSLGEVLHEVMHILGFSHEHTRPDRDRYITVLWDNIKPGYKKYFEMRTEDPLSSLPYDYASVLHYPARAFSKNGQVTILLESGIKIGQREGLSDNDIAKVTTIYSPECMKRNKEYLLNTCPSVVKKTEISKNVTQTEIENYFKDRLWPYGIINIKIRDNAEFSSEERQNLAAVIHHIEKETCIEFRNTSNNDIEELENNEMDTQDHQLHLQLDKVLDDEEVEDLPNNLDSEKENATSVYDNELSPKKINSSTDNFESDSGKDENGKQSEENFVDLRKNVGSNSYNSKSSKPQIRNSYKPQYKLKASNPRKVKATKPERRHAENTLTLVRSAELGCRCPPPGRPKGDQVLEISSDCFNSVNDLLHVFVHILGLDHQHNMYDRDSYLRILWDQLTPEINKEMENKLPPAASVGFPYDYQSVTHYPWLQIKNGVTNIMYPIWNDGWAMGHWQGLSSTDVNKLNLIYYEQCSLRKQQTQE